jgi:hypothetical protein
MNDILHRIRWPNVARAAAVLAAVALLASWPHLRGSSPALPPAAPAVAAGPPDAPRVEGTAAARAKPGPGARPANAERRRVTRRRQQRRSVAHARRARHRPARPHRRGTARRPVVSGAPPAVATAPPPAAVPYHSPAPAPAGAEFRP